MIQPCLQGSKKQSKVAVGQMTSSSDREANFLTCQRLAQVMPVQIEHPALLFPLAIKGLGSVESIRRHRMSVILVISKRGLLQRQLCHL